MHNKNGKQLAWPTNYTCRCLNAIKNSTISYVFMTHKTTSLLLFQTKMLVSLPDIPSWISINSRSYLKDSPYFPLPKHYLLLPFLNFLEGLWPVTETHNLDVISLLSGFCRLCLYFPIVISVFPIQPTSYNSYPDFYQLPPN